MTTVPAVDEAKLEALAVLAQRIGATGRYFGEWPAQEVGPGPGAQAGERQLTSVLREARSATYGRPPEPPFTIILVARP